MIQYALSYAQDLGWPVFPVNGWDQDRQCCTCCKSECPSAAKHPATANGFKDASEDGDQIAVWWKQRPELNIGVATGSRSGVLVLDIDAKNGGLDSLEALLQKHGDLPSTPTVNTGGGGKHFYFRYPETGTFKNKANLWPGIDIRGEGGYVVAPPSSHASGRVYSWVQGSEPNTIPLAPPPVWLLEQMNGHPSPNVAGIRWDVIPAGSRNTTLMTYAGSLRRIGLEPDEIMAALAVRNQRCEPPLSSQEVARIARSASRYPIVTQSNPPVPDATMFHGPAGRIVEVLSEHCEADPVGLLVTLLVAYGNLMGKRTYFTISATKHYTNLFACLVGNTARGRKGTSWDMVEAVLSMIDENWAVNCTATGLSSGEGLIHRAKIAMEQDPPEERLLIIESEMGSALKNMRREGNILSPTLRNAWDGRRLGTLTKTDPVQLDKAFIGVIGHITQKELRKLLNETEVANGFGNRFIWVHVTRNKLLPFGGNFDQGLVEKEVLRLRGNLARQLYAVEMPLGSDSEQRWEEIYHELDRIGDDIPDILTSRAEAQVRRLAMVYAAMDGASFVSGAHLEAAYALWRFSEESVRYIFGSAPASRLAAKVKDALHQHPEGLSKTDLHTAVGRNYKAAQIEAAKEELVQQGLPLVEEANGSGATILKLRTA